MQRTAKEIVKKLQDAGYSTYFAGGSVRDTLLGKKPKDIDIATSAKPKTIERLVEKTTPIGKKFGVISVHKNNHQFEIASFRSDSGYSDGRRPDYITYTSAKKDALRRDFTINGIFYDPIKKSYIDYVNGQKDLENKILRFIGNPPDRIKEDPLRILRAIRFKNILKLKYDKESWKALKKNIHLIKIISQERIKDELNKMLDDQSRYESLIDLDISGALKLIIPEFEKCKDVKQPKEYHEEGDVFTHILEAVKTLTPKCPLFVVWAVLLHDLGKHLTYKKEPDRIHFNGHVQKSVEISEKILERLKFPNTERETIIWLIKNHMKVNDIQKMREAKKKKFLLDPRMKWLLAVHKADAKGSKPMDLKLYNELRELIKKEKGRKIPKPILTGNDIMKHLEIEAGPQIGVISEIVHNAQIEGKIKTKKEALAFIRKTIK